MQLDQRPVLANTPTPSQALDVYIASAGLIFLCLERLQQTYPDLNEVTLYSLLSDPSIQRELEQKTRSQLIMQTYEAANEAIQAARGAIGHMEPFEKAKAAQGFLTQLAELTKKQQDININNIVWETLIPAEAAEAVKFLLAGNKQPIIDHDAEC